MNSSTSTNRGTRAFQARLSSRREFFTRTGSGLAGIALTALLAEEAKADPLTLKTPDHTPSAKSVIFLFMEGGPSHVDLFDNKPPLGEARRLLGP